MSQTTTSSRITRYGRHNPTPDNRGGERVTVRFHPNNVLFATRWVNTSGNPTTKLYFTNGETLLLVDDFGAMNGLSCPVHTKTTRKSL